jgi:hypothetical protein
MSIHDLYSKRKKRVEHGSQPEIYQYETLPIEFRRQGNTSITAGRDGGLPKDEKSGLTKR